MVFLHNIIQHSISNGLRFCHQLNDGLAFLAVILSTARTQNRLFEPEQISKESAAISGIGGFRCSG
jgi:hypothetical protein